MFFQEIPEAVVGVFEPRVPAPFGAFVGVDNPLFSLTLARAVINLSR